MDNLAKQINKLENNIIRYIYIKYFQTNQDNSSVASNIPQQQEHLEEEEQDLDDESIEEQETEPILDASRTITNNSNQEQIDETNSKDKIKTKLKRHKILDKYRYTLFKKNILTQKRSCAVISQEELLRDDIHTMNIANKAYERNPKEFHSSNFDIPPDVLRCSFIRKHHHRYIRCKNTISCDDSDMCKKHEENENIYLDIYNDLLETLGIE